MTESREWTYGGTHGALVARTWSGPDRATHVVVVREERSLEARFGAAYRSYRSSVRRYL